MALSRAEIRGGFRGLGIEDGDALVVHGSLSSLGRVEDGAEAVVDALFDAVGERGTVAMPTFTRYDEPYDHEGSPSTVGAITEAFRTRPDVVRSSHPTKSVAVRGPEADRYVAGHEPGNSLGPGSPIHRVVADGASILLCGVDHTANSTLHVAERLAGLPYRDQTAETTHRTDGATETVEVNRVHCSRGFESAGAVASRLGLESVGRVGAGTVRLVDGPALLSLVADLLEADPGLLLCDLPDCERCAYARRRLAE
ncbi:AAC(3) family N-acetyltransferase [Saliphagus infecundisoli]|uniref:AAC(3) family N-acetyltransferase n=1 Tax=Saliphagus infecundisoli TaxID=1849069 RepID=A0ABD5Q9S8_9EURY|nr:AAC(3) family N-acetyltransferase [Saliphagus infecundisoli]